MIAEFIDINVVKFQDENLRRVTFVTPPHCFVVYIFGALFFAF